MTAIQDTAYPRLRSSLSIHELARIYTPTSDELALARRTTRGMVPRICFLVLLKTFQRLGYFVTLTDVPPPIVQHIADAAGGMVSRDDLVRYAAAGTRGRHLAAIRAHLHIQPYGAAARHVLVRAMADAAQTKDAPADLINVAIEELVRQRFELPGFPTLARTARRVRAVTYRTFYQQVLAALDDARRQALDALLIVDPMSGRSPWEQIKQDAGSPTLRHLRERLDYLAWLEARNVGAASLAPLPDVKIKHFAAEAKTLDAARMRDLEPAKRATLTAALLAVQTARTRDDLAEMFIKRMLSIHQQARERLAAYRERHAQQTDALITTFRDVVAAYRSEGSAVQRFAAIDQLIGSRSDTLLEQCEAHIANTANTYLPFLWPCFKSHRATLFRLLHALDLQATTQDSGLESAIRFLLANEERTGEWLTTVETRVVRHATVERTPLVDLSWVSESWWRLLTDVRPRPAYPRRIKRRAFEVCVFSQILWELKSGDLAVVGSDAFADYRAQLIDDAEYARSVEAYGAMVELPVSGQAFVEHYRRKLAEIATETDQAFPSNQAVTIVNGEPCITRPKARPDPVGLAALEQRLADRLHDINILDLLADTDAWLQWTRCFGPISGHASKLGKEAATRYLIAAFCYGCQIGPTQLARTLRTVDRRQIAWVNLRHITEESLDAANRLIINAYNRFMLPKHWGDGRSVSADGTKWDLYEQNLLAEYHIRYGGYGGIGYYHVSDTYIALFSHFIPCGVWEAVYILDGLLKNQSDIQPDTIHADTQGQSEAVFGLAALLGIRLMPRIRHWKHLTFYKPTRDAHYEHLDTLFTETVDWDLIATHLPDMLRVVLSIKAGRITPSTILRKLSTYSQKNKLYQAFRELGRAVRTMFLLDYLSDEELRITINAATNKSESFNHFAQWLAFGGDGTITENDRDAQRKVIKYNHLVANCVIFYNVFAMSRVFHELELAGEAIEDAALAALSPYITAHINRLGRYELNARRRPPVLDYMLFARPVPARQPRTPVAAVA